jgi:hypothetical protein
MVLQQMQAVSILNQRANLLWEWKALKPLLSQ